MIRKALLPALILLSVTAVHGAVSLTTPPHLDKQKLPFGCGSCHVGFDFRSGGGYAGCLVCHGTSGKARRGGAPTTEFKDIEAEFKKPYRHPALEGKGIHSAAEVLPETEPKAPRHAECVDCHNPHLLTAENKFAGIRMKKMGNVISAVTKESELCYRCHGDSANLPGGSTNKRQAFALTNASFHPVEGEGRNSTVISLVKPYRERKVNSGDVSIISCGECHGSDNPAAPRGPHGSTNQFLLVENYATRDGETESSYTYAICYRCHSRTSILGDESFRYHSLHIRGKGVSLNATGTSCYTCHDSHGSMENKYLIRFNPEVVSPNSAGVLKFVSKGIGSFRGECYLTCHGVNHNPRTY